MSDTKAGLILLQNLPDHFQAFAQGYQASRLAAWDLDDLCTQLQSLPLPRTDYLAFASISKTQPRKSNDNKSLYSLSSVEIPKPTNTLPPLKCPFCTRWHWKSECPERFRSKFGHISSNCRARNFLQLQANSTFVSKPLYALSAISIPQELGGEVSPQSEELENGAKRTNSQTKLRNISETDLNQNKENVSLSNMLTNPRKSLNAPTTIPPDRRSVGLSARIGN